MKKYTRAEFLRAGGKLHVRHKVEIVHKVEVTQPEKPESKHKRRRANGEDKSN